MEQKFAAIELEEAILGAMLFESTVIKSIVTILKAEYFYEPKHQIVYKAIEELNKKSEKVDILTVTNKLRKDKTLDKVGGASFITSLTNRVASSANIKRHSYIVLEKYLYRKVANLLKRKASEVLNEEVDPLDFIYKLQKELKDFTKETGVKIIPQYRALQKAIEFLENEETGTRIYTGFSEIDDKTGGFRGGNLVTIAGRTSMGKTSLALKFMYEAAVNQNKRVMMSSYEMTKEEVTINLLAIGSYYSIKKVEYLIKTGEAHTDKVLGAELRKIENAPIFYDEQRSDIFGFINKVHSQYNEEGIDMTILDYIQLVKPSSKRQTIRESINEAMAEYKGLCKELDIVGIDLAQVSRGSELTQHKKPSLKDLKESSAIEEGSDYLFFVYRPSYYGLKDPDGTPISDEYAEIIMAKGRRSGTKTFDVYFKKDSALFTSYKVNESN